MHKEATEIIEEMDEETAFKLLYKIAKSDPKILMDCYDDLFDEE